MFVRAMPCTMRFLRFISFYRQSTRRSIISDEPSSSSWAKPSGFYENPLISIRLDGWRKKKNETLHYIMQNGACRIWTYTSFLMDDLARRSDTITVMHHLGISAAYKILPTMAPNFTLQTLCHSIRSLTRRRVLINVSFFYSLIRELTD